MKQGFRLFVKPGQFFNQLQWSSNHWPIIGAFAALTLIETQTGHFLSLYQDYAILASNALGIPLSFATALVMTAKISLMLAGAVFIALVLHTVGSIVGGESSRRVFVRRMAVVMTVILAAYTADLLSAQMPPLVLAAFVLYGWGVVLGFFALREQFGLNVLQTGLMSLIAFLMVYGGWNGGHSLLQKSLIEQFGRHHGIVEQHNAVASPRPLQQQSGRNR